MIPVKRPAEMASIWGEDSVLDDTAMAEDEDDDDEAADPTDLDNFVIDDMGMGTEDEPQRGEISGKEFGSFKMVIVVIHSFKADCARHFSEYHKSAASLPAGCNTDAE